MPSPTPSASPSPTPPTASPSPTPFSLFNDCGNGILDFPGEQCDDNNCDSGDGCSDECQTEGMPSPTPTESCGNNVLETGEQCDDGNTEDGDGCSCTCEMEEMPSATATP